MKINVLIFVPGILGMITWIVFSYIHGTYFDHGPKGGIPSLTLMASAIYFIPINIGTMAATFTNEFLKKPVNRVIIFLLAILIGCCLPCYLYVW